MGPCFAQKTSATANPHQEAILEGQIFTPTRQKRVVRCTPSQGVTIGVGFTEQR